MITAHADAAIGFRELDEVRQRFRVALRIAVTVQELLPLAHHAHVLVVENEDLDRQAVLHGRRHLLDVHEDRGVTGNVDAKRLGMRDLRADRGREPIAHGAEAAARQPAVRLVELQELRRPHLVLADFRRDVDIAIFDVRLQPLERELRHDHVGLRLVL